MATDEKGIPPSYVHVGAATPPYVPSAAPAAGYEGQQPAVAANQYPTPGPYYYPRGQPPPPAYQQQQTTGVVIVGGPTPVAQNVLVVRTVRANVQIPDVYPGPAFCLFAPGIIETFIRSSVVVMLLVLIAVAAAAIDEESQTVYDYSYNYRYNYRYNYNDDVIVDARGWRGAAGWIIFVAGVALITEGIMLLLRFVNPKCFNNSYGVFGGLDIAKCVLVGIGLFIGCVITGIEIAVADSDLSDYCDTPFRNSDNNAACEQLERIRRIVIALTDISRCILVGIGLFVGCIITGAEAALAADDIDNHCDDNPYNTDNNRACRQLETIYNVVIAVTTVNVLCLVLLMTLATWDIIYIYNGLNFKVPVPRARDQANQQRQTENAIMNRL